MFNVKHLRKFEKKSAIYIVLILSLPLPLQKVLAAVGTETAGISVLRLAYPIHMNLMI